jgi:glutathione S-transferase
MYVGNMSTSILSKFFQPTDAALVSKCREDLNNTFATLNAMLQKSGGKYIAGDHLTAGDIAIASLAAVVVMPDLYCNGECRSVFAKLELRDDDYVKELNYWRGTPIGQYVLRMYSDHRQRH